MSRWGRPVRRAGDACQVDALPGLACATASPLTVARWVILSWIQPIRKIAATAAKNAIPRRGWVQARRLAVLGALLLVSLGFNSNRARAATGSGSLETNILTFQVEGAIQRLGQDGVSLVVKHEAVPGYMDAMTMPFHVKDQAMISGLRAGDLITFQLHVTDDESWIDHIVKTGTAPELKVAENTLPPPAPPHHNRALLDFKFTDELGRPVSVNDFRGQALAITFFFTRCPIPDYCPRLSRNFQEASQRLAAMPGAPTNWHFLSITFDPEFDTPAVLKEYAQRYQYNPARWNFLTGPPDKINELVAASGVEVKSDTGLFNHNFRTLIVDARGHLQTTFPFGGDLSDMIVREMLKAAAVTQETAAASPAGAPATSSRAAPMQAPESNPR